ncbi:MAG: ABC transporter substrate-binding protein, partial [Eubacteriales bacterium]|nr:ABC transporter substrate-binding protein [Eubacteriales bacterium]
MKRRMLALLLALVMVVGLCACGTTTTTTTPAPDASTDTENIVAIAMGSGFDTMDPGHCYEKYPALVINACYENLFKFYSNDGAAEPCLAETYEFSEDNLTLTITLREGATFASGNPVTAADVKFSLDRTKNLKGNPSFITDTIASVETPDEKTVVINLTQPDSAITSKLTYSALAILDSAVVMENGGTAAEDASTTDTAQAYLDTTSAGSGMYIMTSYIPDDEIVLERNPNYSGTPTNVDKYII